MYGFSDSPSYSEPDPSFDSRAYLRDLVRDRPRLFDVIKKGQAQADRLIASFRTLITPRVGVGLLHGLALAEVARAIRMSVRTTPSDLCGQARFLRGLIVSHPLDPDGTVEVGEPMARGWYTTLAIIDELWTTLFWIERLQGELAKHDAHADKRRIERASTAATLGRTELDIGFVEPVEERCRAVFTQLDHDFVVPTFGLDTDQMLTGFPAIWSRVNHRIRQVGAMTKAKQQASAENQEIIESLAEQRLDVALEVSGDDLPPSWTDVQRKAFLDAFSIVGGESNKGFCRPSDDNVTLRKPFLRLSGDRYYLMDFVFSRYAPSRLLCHAAESSSSRERFFRIRDLVLEKRAGDLFAAAAPPTVHYSGVFLPVGKNGDLAEQDHIVIAGGRAFLLECKAGRVRSPQSHEGNVTKLAADLRASVQTAFDQGERARQYLTAAQSTVPIYNKFRTQIGTIDRGLFTTAHVVVVTWESLCSLSVDLQPWLDVPEGTEYPWVVWIDQLEAALSRLRPAEEIAKYVAWRSTLSGRLFAGDELQVVGCFLAGHIDFPAGSEPIVIPNHYGEIFDDDYYAKGGVRREITPIDPKPSIVRFDNEDGRRTARLDGKLLYRSSEPEMARPKPTGPAISRFKKRRRKH